LAPLAEALAGAAKRVQRVAEGRSLAFEEGRDAATTDLVFSTLRRYGRSQALLAALTHRGQATDALIEALLWCALTALESGRYADYTVLDQAGRACELLDKARAKGFVNAILRSFQRGRAALEARMRADDEARFQHPRWWVDRLRAQYPGDAEAILAAGNTHPPMCLRVNARKLTREAYREQLGGAGIAASIAGPSALLLQKPLPALELPGFAEGLVSVQDAGAQRAALLLEVRDGERVLDACAAPGGKASHLLESAAIELTALDTDATRLRDVERGLERLGLRAQLRAADCAAPETWWDGKPYDRILADVPCSASGIVRRHPDIKWLRRKGDAESFAARQSKILDSLWRLLAPGGKLLYVTCSVFHVENEAVVERFLERSPGARRGALADGGPAQLLPADGHDGFYFALLEKPD
jgi:16S rRNA (cytosine967-C5)-methyltransferase